MKDQRHKSHDGDQHGLLATQKNGGVLREKDAWITKRATQCPASSSIIQVWPAAADGPNNTIRRIRWEIARKENNNESKAILIHCLALSVFFKKRKWKGSLLVCSWGDDSVSLTKGGYTTDSSSLAPGSISLLYSARYLGESGHRTTTATGRAKRERERFS